MPSDCGHAGPFFPSHTHEFPVDQDVMEPRLLEHRHLNLKGEFPLPFISSPLMEVPLTAGKKTEEEKKNLLKIAAAHPFETYKHTLNGLNRR